MPKPVTQSGGIKAVAMATPGIALLLSFRVVEMIPEWKDPHCNIVPFWKNVTILQTYPKTPSTNIESWNTFLKKQQPFVKTILLFALFFDVQCFDTKENSVKVQFR